MKSKKIKCDIYTRVSTTMQIDGYSLDAQKEKLKRYAEFQNMEIVNEYSDEGKSGKSVEGRPEFQRMLDNIENGTDEVQFVLLFKLSRFGRNAADVLNSLQRMQDFGVNLICVEDGIDSSKDSGKLMISVLSAVAEIERENILVQTMEGRKQKAREGKWNGGFAPYGYELVNGELQIAEDEAEIIRLIYDKFIHTNMGISAIAAWLNQHGYKKKKRQNNTLDAFASSFIKGVLDNPVYCGKLAYGRRKNEKVSGTRNEYRIVKQENYMLHDGIHEGIISETDWELAFGDRETQELCWDNESTVETVVLLSKGEVDSKKIRVEFSLEDMDMSEFQDGATYTQIKDYVLEHSGLKVSNLYISQIKRKCGIEVGKNYNLPKSEDSRQPQCPPEKEKAIREAFKYFGMI